MTRALGIAAAALLLIAACTGASARETVAPPLPDDVSVAFSPTTLDFPNPERGFYSVVPALDALGPSEAAAAFAAGRRLVYTRLNLEPYRDAELPAAYLDAVEAGFAAARRGGVKLIVRAVYNYPRGETAYRDAQDAPLARVLGHIAQLKPVLQRNADIVAFVQAGFVGAWGEWHTSSNALTEEASRTRIKDALLDAVPATRQVQFRYPPHIQQWSPELPALDAALDHGFRVGFHNDCFLASATDVGTFEEDGAARERQRRYLDALGELSVFGGETCNPADEQNPAPRTTCADILGEGARFNLTYLNARYYRRLFHEQWIADGCMDAVSRSMGYRLALVSATHPRSALRGEAFALSIVVRNEGWARLVNPRAIEVVLRERESGSVRRYRAGGADPRRWLPGATSAATLRIVLPEDAPPGVFDVLLALPDADARLRNDPRYAVRWANANDAAKRQEWSASLGAFALGTSLTIR